MIGFKGSKPFKPVRKTIGLNDLNGLNETFEWLWKESNYVNQTQNHPRSPDHPRCQAIIDGKVGIEGYELDVDPNFVSSGERHYKYLHGEWDVGEVSAASLLRAIEKGQQLLAIPVFFERGPRQRNIYHCEQSSKTSVGTERQKVRLFSLRRHRRGLGTRLPARRARHQNNRHAMVRLRPGSFHRPRAAGQSAAHRTAATLRRREAACFQKCSVKANCTAPSFLATMVMLDFSAAAKRRR